MDKFIKTKVASAEILLQNLDLQILLHLLIKFALESIKQIFLLFNFSKEKIEMNIMLQILKGT